MKTFLASSLLLLICSPIDANKPKTCVDNDFKEYRINSGYQANCTQFTCKEVEENMEMVASDFCCWNNGQKYEVGEIVATRHVQQVTKCETVAGKPTVVTENNDRKFCTYKGRVVQLGEELPLPEVCAVLTCSLELINDSVLIPSLDLDRSLPGHGCCTGEDGSIYVEGSNRTRPSGQEVTCHQGTWTSVCRGEDGSIYVERSNRTSPSGQEVTCHQGTWTSVCRGEDGSIYVERSNRTKPSGLEVTCYQGTWTSLRAGLNLAVRPQSQDERIDTSLILFNKDRHKDKNGVEGWRTWQNRTKIFLEEHQQPLEMYKYCQDVAYTYGCLMAFHRDELHECGRGNFGYDTGTPCVILRLNRIFGLEYDYYQAQTEEDPYPDEFPQELAIHIDAQENKKQVWVDCEGVNATDSEMMGPLTYHPRSRGLPISYFPYLDQVGYQSPLLAIKFENPTIGVLLNIACRAWAKNIEYGKAHFQLMIYSNEVNPNIAGSMGH